MSAFDPKRHSGRPLGVTNGTILDVLSGRSDQDARNAGWSDPSSTEKSTGIISFVVTLPFGSFSTTTSCWAPSRPTGITILPPALSWLISGGGIRSGAAVAITLSNGAWSGQPA